ncbi:hypothetical protein EJ03DRAFT_42318 [Teratosphaeria nubilosa]|uniref:Uncharacterized protein n=1 Tax=Teratosphaeria nubilosa TaxID=161662 RepID=A0A6G1KTU9_9PEZI|nr:hypothetical protein EJ03DRAFT_42318 [Teratosphaeria nubilosa]
MCKRRSAAILQNLRLASYRFRHLPWSALVVVVVVVQPPAPPSPCSTLHLDLQVHVHKPVNPTKRPHKPTSPHLKLTPSPQTHPLTSPNTTISTTITMSSSFTRFIDKILTSKYNKPLPVTLLPSAIGYYLGLKQGERQAQVLEEIRALGDKDLRRVREIAGSPR